MLGALICYCGRPFPWRLYGSLHMSNLAVLESPPKLLGHNADEASAPIHWRQSSPLARPSKITKSNPGEWLRNLHLSILRQHESPFEAFPFLKNSQLTYLYQLQELGSRYHKETCLLLPGFN